MAEYDLDFIESMESDTWPAAYASWLRTFNENTENRYTVEVITSGGYPVLIRLLRPGIQAEMSILNDGQNCEVSAVVNPVVASMPENHSWTFKTQDDTLAGFMVFQRLEALHNLYTLKDLCQRLGLSLAERGPRAILGDRYQPGSLEDLTTLFESSLCYHKAGISFSCSFKKIQVRVSRRGVAAELRLPVAPVATLYERLFEAFDAFGRWSTEVSCTWASDLGVVVSAPEKPVGRVLGK